MLITFSIKAIKMKIKNANCQKIDFPLQKHISKTLCSKSTVQSFLFKENDRRTLDFVIKLKKPKKDIPSDHLVRLTPNYLSMN